MKIIFLDIDGVLVGPKQLKIASGIRAPFCRESVRWLAKLVSETGAKIVITSTWRFNYIDHHSFQKEVFDKKNTFLEAFDYTPKLMKERGTEIWQWLEQHLQVGQYVILDDEPMHIANLRKCQVQTNFENLFGKEHYEKALSILMYQPNIT